MRSTFFGLDIAYKALLSQQRALDITGHNVANANTQGYTRQDVIMEATTPVKTGQGFVGTGVNIAEFRRVRDAFIDVQLRTENKALGEWETKADILGKIEVVINEPSEAGLRSVLDNYWGAWQQLSKDPASTAVRATVVQNGITLADTFKHAHLQFQELQRDINKGINVKVDEVNSYARQISDLNSQIIKAEAEGHKANDLRDKRDLLVENLSKILDIDVVEDAVGAISVVVGGMNLVSRSFITELKFTDNETDPNAASLQWINSITGASQGSPRIKSGQLQGYLEMRDEIQNTYIYKLDELAKSLAEEVNKFHNMGYALDGNPGQDFFTKPDPAASFGAANIEVNQQIVANMNLVAACSVDPVIAGNGDNALVISQLRNKKLMEGNNTTYDDYYRAMVAVLGVHAQEAERMADNQYLLTEQLRNKQMAVSGVSLDEEMANMIKFQHAYTASARVINVMDEMLDVIVNRLGMAGR